MKEKHIVVTEEVFAQVKRVQAKMKPVPGKKAVTIGEVIARVFSAYETLGGGYEKG